jgi:hypothetical protein
MKLGFSKLLSTICVAGALVWGSSALANIGGRVWVDNNCNGFFEAGDVLLPGVTVTLYNCDLNQTVASVVTDANGFFQFTNPGVISNYYKVCVTAPAGYTFAPPHDPGPPVGEECCISSVGANGCTECFFWFDQNDLTHNAGLCARAGCHIFATVSCPNNGNSAPGIVVCATSTTIPGQPPTCGVTDGNGFVDLFTPGMDTYMVCVHTNTLPANATLANPCQNITCSDLGASVTFDLSGDFCSSPPTNAMCWMTGGGTIGNGRTPTFSYGGVVYPGCSPHAADGGNWNVIDHDTGLHFQGQHIIVDSCSGVPVNSPKVRVNIIDFHGDGRLMGVGGNPQATIAVTFVGRAIDNNEPGHDRDQLYIQVVDPITHAVLLQIGNSADHPATVSTGNLQIHTSSCGH